MKHALTTAFCLSISAICFLGSCNPDPELIEPNSTNAYDDRFIGSWRRYNHVSGEETDRTYHFLENGIAFITRDDDLFADVTYEYHTSNGVIFLIVQFGSGAGNTLNYDYVFNSDTTSMTWSYINGTTAEYFQKLD